MASTSWTITNEIKFITKRNNPTKGATLCALCEGSLETKTHLFVHCPIASKVWNNIHVWFGFVLVLPGTIISHFEKKGRNGQKGVILV
ncbi:unnamed protein product [Trifolium pratense]|uniref:Uncharacterized protein n=1 Tax=Trifolium pratense TaxID=57577 RepID=A0ACB0KJE6_TRIPR|nr:unnamed protein product [Trifolium pratense]